MRILFCTVRLSCAVFGVQFLLSDTGEHLSKGQINCERVCFCVNTVTYYMGYSLSFPERWQWKLRAKENGTSETERVIQRALRIRQ